MKCVRGACDQVNPCLCIVDGPRAMCAERMRRAGRQLEGLSDIAGELLRLGTGIAQRQNSFFRRPGRPTINLQPARIAADPMRIDKCRCILPRPLRSFGQHIPIRLAKQRRSDIQLLQLRAGSEVRVDLVGEVVAWIGGKMRRLCAKTMPCSMREFKG